MVTEPDLRNEPRLLTPELLGPGPQIAHRLLTRREEYQLARRIEQGDQTARQQLIECNLRLVHAIARRYLNTGIGLSDLFQEGVIGLIQAVDHFDWRRGTRFSTSATLWVRQAISRALPSLGHTIRIPARLLQAIGQLDATAEALQQEHQRPITDEELAAQIGRPLENVEDLRCLPVRLISLETPPEEEHRVGLGETLPDHDTPDPTRAICQQELLGEVMAAFAELSPREQAVLKLRFGLGAVPPLTLSEIGTRLGLSRQRIKQIEAAALLRLRQFLTPAAAAD